jgi:Alr-MurF fusion protein
MYLDFYQIPESKLPSANSRNPMKFLTEPINTEATYLLNDSRQLSFPSQSIFFAIKGLHHDGHQYVSELYRKGVRDFVVEKDACTKSFLKEIAQFSEANFWQVKDSITALQNLVKTHREKFHIPILAVTGSNGKTIVKEWLSQLLGQRYKIVKSPKSYNSQIGVPLSVWQLNEGHNFGIFEAGISRTNEMENLEKVIQPTVGIFTNIGTAHNEFFESNYQKISEKVHLFAHVKTLIYCADYTEIDEVIQKEFIYQNPDCQLLAWSRVLSGGIRIDWKTEKKSAQLNVDFKGRNLNFQVPFTDDASIENLVHCVILMLHLGFTEAEIQSRLPMLRPVSMRLELKEGINNCYLIDDTYNNDLAGLNIALNFLSQQQQRPNKILILSDLLETGIPERDLYLQISRLIADKGIRFFVGIGEVISRNKKYFQSDALFYKNTESFLKEFSLSNLQNSIVLVKGARKFGFEQIINRTVQKTHGTVLEINLDAVTNNFNYFREKIGSQTKIMVMVKAFAYGSGSSEVANLLQFHGVDYLAVAYADEGVRLRQSGIYTPIMVMNPSSSDFQKMSNFQLEPEIYSLKILKEYSDFIDSQQMSGKIHLKLDTGMHRLGFEPEHLPELLEALGSNPNLWISSIFSHLAGADEAHLDDFTKNQVAVFTEMANNICVQIGYFPSRHLANSAGIARFPEARLDMVRLGIGLYGVAAQTDDQVFLQTVGTLKTVISQIKNVKSGESIGYGRKGFALRDTKVATIAIGYADGFDRGFSNGVGEVLVNGTPCPVIGNVCMDMTMVDITNAQAEEGDEVVVFGNYPTISELAKKINTIPYEILTGVGERVKRVFYQM